MLEKRKTVFTYIRYNVDQIQNDLTLMFAGEKIPSGVQEYAETAQELKTKEEIYSAIGAYGQLCSNDEKRRIFGICGFYFLSNQI